MKTKGVALRQVILFVQEKESEVRFYRDVMGFDFLSPGKGDSFSEEIWVKLASGDCIGGAQEPAGGHRVSIHPAMKFGL